MKQFALLIIAALAGCGSPKDKKDEVTPNVDPAISYEAEVLPILKESCSPCHAEGSKLSNYAANDEALLKANASSVLARIQLDQNEKGFMPKGGSPLSPENLKTLRDFLQ